MRLDPIAIFVPLGVLSFLGGFSSLWFDVDPLPYLVAGDAGTAVFYAIGAFLYLRPEFKRRRKQRREQRHDVTRA